MSPIMWAKNKIVHFRLPKTTLNDISFIALSPVDV